MDSWGSLFGSKQWVNYRVHVSTSSFLFPLLSHLGQYPLGLIIYFNFCLQSILLHSHCNQVDISKSWTVSHHSLVSCHLLLIEHLEKFFFSLTYESLHDLLPVYLSNFRVFIYPRIHCCKFFGLLSAYKTG